jgi:hypothetical protein
MTKPTGCPPTKLIVVGCSGRTFWPVKGNEAEVSGSLSDPLSVLFCYPIDHIPPGKRNPIRSWVRDRTPVMIRSVDESEVKPAFRIHWHDRARETTKIIHFEDGLWWSVQGAAPARRLVAALATGEPAALGLLDPNLVTDRKIRATSEVFSGHRIVLDGLYAARALVQRGATNLIIVDDQIFVRNGEPLYALWNGDLYAKYGRQVSFDISGELYNAQPKLGFDDRTNWLIFGRVFSANQLEEALDLARQDQIDVEKQAVIEMLSPELASGDSFVAQTDAMFQRLARLVSVPRDLPTRAADELQTMLRRLSEAGRRDVTERAEAMKLFIEWSDPNTTFWKSKFRLERWFVTDAIKRLRLEGRVRHGITPFSDQALTDQDVEALAQLAI